MKHLIPFFPVVLLSALALSGCQSLSNPSKSAGKHVVVTAPSQVKETYPVLPPASGMIRLTEGQRLTLPNQPVTLSFDKVLSDNRCPSNVQCIWAGNATIALTVTSTQASNQVPNQGLSQTLKLSSGDLRGDLVRKAQVGGFDISLETLYPTPTATVGFDKLTGKYMADIKVTPVTP